MKEVLDFLTLDRLDSGKKFLKLNGSGNDFVLLDGTEKKDLLQSEISRICDRKYGVGCDQLLLIKKLDGNKIYIEIYNSDSTKAQNCGNGLRSVAGYFLHRQQEYVECSIFVMYNGTEREFLCKKLTNGMVSVGIGKAFVKGERELFIDVGNLHKVVVLESRNEESTMEGIKLPKPINKVSDKDFNLNYITIDRPDRVLLTTVERGSGETLCCGSGSCASVVFGVHKNLLPNGKEIEIITQGTILDGNRSLYIKAKQLSDREYDVELIGSHNVVFCGDLDVSLT